MRAVDATQYAKGFGLKTYTIDGTDFRKSYETIQKAFKEIRETRRALIKLPAIIAKRRHVSSNERDHNDITIIEKMDHNENNNDDQIINHKKHGCNKKKQDIDEDIHDYICPINLELMLEPV